MQPLERFGMDAAILFSDILLLLEAMGVGLRFDENVGPLLDLGPDKLGALDRLFVPDPEEKLGFVMETIQLLKDSLQGQTPLIGFSGAPFTLATYLIEGGSSRHFFTTKSFMYQESAAFHKLMALLARAVELFLKAQIQAGAQAVQLFDTWAGVLSPGDYREFVQPYTQQIFEGLSGEGVPLIHYSLGSSTLLEEMNQTGAQVLGLDWKIDMGEARNRLGPSRAVQGNLEPFVLLGTSDRLEASVREILDKGSRYPGFIFNLGHGIHLKTPLENVQKLVEIVRSFRPASQQDAPK